MYNEARFPDVSGCGKCRLCADIDRKRKRILEEEQRIRRWKGEPAAWEMSVANSELAIAELQKKIQDLTKQRKTKLSR
jgi:hypothetical protein